MSNSKTAKSTAPALRVIHGTGNPKAATLEDLTGVIKVMRVARDNGIDLKVQLHVGATTVDVTNAADQPTPMATQPREIARFWKVAADGRVVPDDAKDWEGVYDASARLIWARKLLAGAHAWADAQKVAAAATLCGAPARAPTIQERLSIVDYSRTEPALNTSFFDPSEKNGWEWTSTPAAAPSGDAWYVCLGYGGSGRNLQSLRNRVRAVRAGQPLGFEF